MTEKTKNFYISFDREELTLLGGVGHTALALYFVLKRLNNFKTGRVGTFRNQKITLNRLADEIGRPSSQGRQAVEFDAKAVSRLLDELEALGLVAERGKDENNNLVMMLPKSPMDDEDKSQAKSATAKKSPGKLPREESDHGVEAQQGQGVSPASPAPSVLVSLLATSPKDNPISITDINTSGRAFAPPAVARNAGDWVEDGEASGVAAANDAPQAIQSNDNWFTSDADEWAEENWMAVLPDSILTLLRQLDFAYCETDLTQKIVEGWVQSDFNAKAIARAAEDVSGLPIRQRTAGEIDARLRGAGKAKGSKRRHGGGLVL